jgi:hypothetical protein
MSKPPTSTFLAQNTWWEKYSKRLKLFEGQKGMLYPKPEEQKVFKFTSYIPSEPAFGDYLRVGISQSSYMEQANITDLMSPKEKLAGSTILINDKLFKVHSWELDGESFVVCVKPVEEKA